MTPAVRSSTPRFKIPTGSAMLWLLPLGFLGLFFFYPLGVIFSASFSHQALAVTPAGWQRIFSTTLFTIWQAALSTLLTFAVGLPGAYLLARFDFRGRRFLQVLTSLPFILPTVVVAAGFTALLGPRGWLNLALMALFHLADPPVRILGTLPTILLAHVFYNTTIVLRLVGGAWAGLNPRPGLAARTLGATPWQEFSQITLPLLAPAIASAAVLVFLFDFTSFGVIMLLGGAGLATLEVEIYTQAIHLFNLPTAAILTMVQFAITLILFIINKKVSTRPIPLIPAAERMTARRPSTPRQHLFTIGMSLVMVLLIISPLLALVTRSFTRLEADRGQRTGVQTGLTTDYYTALFQNPRGNIFYVPPVDAVANSLRYALWTAVLAVGLGLPAAYGLNGRGRFARWMDVLFMLPLGASAVTMGLGLLLAFTRPPLNWAAFPWMIPAAHTLVALPLVLRTLLPALASIPPSLRQSAAVLGADPLRAFLQVDLPLLRRPLITSLIFSFTVSLGEFGATTFLARPEYPTIPIAIFRYLSQPGALNYGQAMALSTILLLLFLLGMLLIEKLRLPGMEVF
jgi:thiamine transport system permease protein